MTDQHPTYLGVTRIHGKGDKPYAATVAPMGKFFFADTFATAEQGTPMNEDIDTRYQDIRDHLRRATEELTLAADTARALGLHIFSREIVEHARRVHQTAQSIVIREKPIR
jgi:hypothetical protein